MKLTTRAQGRSTIGGWPRMSCLIASWNGISSVSRNRQVLDAWGERLPSAWLSLLSFCTLEVGSCQGPESASASIALIQRAG